MSLPIPPETPKKPKDLPASPSDETTSNRPSWFLIVATATALFALVGYTVFIYYLKGKVAVEATQWSRLIYLFSGIEAIVFAAVGFLFGREVNRGRADRAESQVEVAKKNEIEAREVAKETKVKAEMLAAQIMSKVDPTPGVPLAYKIKSSSVDNVQRDFESLASVVRTMFPGDNIK